MMKPLHAGPSRVARAGRLALAASVLTLRAAAAHAETATPATPPAPNLAAPEPTTVAPSAGVPAPLPPTVAAPASVLPELTIGTPGGTTATLYGFVELDVMHDSTQSFGDGVVNNTLTRPAFIGGDNPRTQFTVRNSRFGFRINAPDYGVVRTSAVMEMDFFGNQPSTVSEDSTFTNAAVRMRHYYVKFETPVIDVLAGQYHDLFGWGGAGFYPNTIAFLGVNGQIYHRDPQLRLSHRFSGRAVEVEAAAAAVRPAQRDGEAPDVEAGVRIAIQNWRGVSNQGASLSRVAPAGLGISGLGRRFSVLPFSPNPGDPNVVYGWGAAANLFLPIIPAHGENVGNALSVTGEASIGSGIANEYTGLTGGAAFPTLPNPQMLVPVPQFTPDVDPGLVTYDANNQLKTINWRALVIGAQYHLPVAMGRKLWLSAIYSQMQSTNLLSLTPVAGIPFVFTKALYVDGTLFWSPTPSSQVGASVQRQQQTFGDGVKGVNYRGELSVFYFY
jgi:hypothetical protein